MNPVTELKRLTTILSAWAPHGPADGRYFEAKEIVRYVDTYIQTHPIPTHAAGKIRPLQADLDDLLHRDGKDRNRVASFESLLESASYYAATLQEAFGSATQN